MQIDEPEAIRKLRICIEDAVRSCIHERTGVAFSGGIDSSLIASIAASMNPDIELYTIGLHDSHDIKQAQKAAPLLGLADRLTVCECISAEIESAILPVVHAIKSTNPVAVGIGICMYLVSRCAHEHGIGFLLTGQGADELFAGYRRHEQAFDDGKLDYELEKDVHALSAQIERDIAVARLNGVELCMPMFHHDVMDVAGRVDAGLKMRREAPELIRGSKYIRKYILRKVSEHYLPAELVWVPKKAAQYGTGIQNVLGGLARKRGLRQEEFLRQLLFQKG